MESQLQLLLGLRLLPTSVDSRQSTNCSSTQTQLTLRSAAAGWNLVGPQAVRNAVLGDHQKGVVVVTGDAMEDLVVDRRGIAAHTQLAHGPPPLALKGLEFHSLDVSTAGDHDDCSS